MRKSISEIQHRRNAIVQLVNSAAQEVTVHTIAEAIDVSAMTIRRDLSVLDHQGYLHRTHGGAQKIANQSIHQFEDDLIMKSLAMAAAAYIENNKTLFINSSRTALMTLDYSADKIFTVITNNLRVGAEAINPQTNLILTGGEIRYPKAALVGDIANNTLINIVADMAIMGCSGISVDKGMTTNNIHEAKVNQLMVSHTNDLVIVVASHEKIGKDTNFIVCDTSFIDILITDDQAPEEEIRKFRDLDILVKQIPTKAK